jgi:hypothetical protein
VGFLSLMKKMINEIPNLKAVGGTPTAAGKKLY